MFDGGFKEASETSASFPEDSVEVFDHFIRWIYYRKLRKLTAMPGDNGVTKSNWSWIIFYNLAEEICMRELMDQILDSAISFYLDTKTFPTCNTISFGYSTIPSGAPARRYLAMTLQYIIQAGPIYENRWPTTDIQTARAFTETGG